MFYSVVIGIFIHKGTVVHTMWKELCSHQKCFLSIALSLLCILICFLHREVMHCVSTRDSLHMALHQFFRPSYFLFFFKLWYSFSNCKSIILICYLHIANILNPFCNVVFLRIDCNLFVVVILIINLHILRGIQHLGFKNIFR